MNVKGKRKPTKQHRNFNKESETLKGSAHENSRGVETQKNERKKLPHTKRIAQKKSERNGLENGTEKKQKEGLHSGTAKFEESQNTKKNNGNTKNGNTKNEGTVHFGRPLHTKTQSRRSYEANREAAKGASGGSNPGWNSGGLGEGGAEHPSAIWVQPGSNLSATLFLTKVFGKMQAT